MLNLESLAAVVRNEGYSEVNAEARVCQDIILKAISMSSLNRNVTIKGGVVMRSVTGDVRRATQDLDFDFIRYSLSEESIRLFVSTINCLEGIKIEITGDIEELSQQEYRGKRIYVNISDEDGNHFMSKIDLGVHVNMQIEQEDFCFDLCMDDVGTSLLINSKEQIFAEKLRSLLRFGPVSTRYKDVFDMCYLTDYVNKERLAKCIDTYILSDPGMKENEMEDIIRRVELTFNNRLYKHNIERAVRANWQDVDVYDAFAKIRQFLSRM